MERGPGIPQTGPAEEPAAGQLCQHGAVPGLALSRAGEIISSGRLPHFQHLRALHGNTASYADALASQSVSPCATVLAPEMREGAGRVLQ